MFSDMYTYVNTKGRSHEDSIHGYHMNIPNSESQSLK